MKTEKEIAIDEILDNFNFDRVHRVMNAINWVWADKDDMNIEEVPSIGRIVRTATRMLSEAYDNKTGIATGGFCVKWTKDCLTLEFILEEWTADFN